MNGNLLDKPERGGSFFGAAPTGRWLLLILVFSIAVAIRVFGIGETPLDFHPVKQYRSAMSARAYYYERLDSVPEWKLTIAAANMKRLGQLHPQFLYRLAAAIYVVTGAEHLWILRLLLALIWVAGGLCLYLLALQVAPRATAIDAALAAAAFYLLLPFAVMASQSFQIDPLANTLMVLSLLLLVRYYKSPSVWRLLAAAILSAVTALVKPTCLPVIVGGFAGLAIGKYGLRQAVLDPRHWAYAVVSVLPAVIYYGRGALIGGVHQTQAQVSFLPHYILDEIMWRGWLERVRLVMGFTWPFLGVLGLLLYHPGWRRSFVVGLWAGYMAMCFSFSYPMSTHDYYHLLLVPVVGLSLLPLASLAVERLRQVCTTRHWRVAAWGVVVVGLVFAGGISVQRRTEVPDFGVDVRMAQEIGEHVSHSAATIVLDEFYGRALMYHGEFSADAWPPWTDIRDGKIWGLPELSAKDQLAALSASSVPEYFVVTDFRELELQPQLRRLLADSYPVLVRTDEYLIYGLREEQ